MCVEPPRPLPPGRHVLHGRALSFGIPEMTVPEAFFLNCSDFRRTLRAAVFRAIQRNILGEKN